MKIFRLFVRVGDVWELACSVLAENSEKAMQEGKLMLKAEHQNKLLEIRGENDPPPPAHS